MERRDASRGLRRLVWAGLLAVALIVGAIALLVSPVSILGWIVGTAAVVTGFMAVKHPAAAKQGKIGIGLGVAAILIGVFFFTLNIAMY